MNNIWQEVADTAKLYVLNEVIHSWADPVILIAMIHAYPVAAHKL